MRLDTYDLKILAALQEQGRMTNQDLADHIFLSASATLKRVKRLEAEGIISGYQAIITPQNANSLLSAFLEITLETHFPRDFRAFDHYVQSLDAVISAHKVSGRFDYLLYVMTRNMAALSRLSDQLLEANINIAKLVTVPIIDEVKLHRGVPLGLLDNHELGAESAPKTAD